jgi:hypothetical protein
VKAIPTGPLSLCDALDQLGEAAWEEIELGVETHQLLDEEAVTNYHLMRLAAAVPAVRVEKHSKRREWRTGADWEIWVGRPGGFVGFRVQAKILDHRTNRYERLYHRVADRTKQIDKLISSSQSSPRQTYPLYAFYNYSLAYPFGPTAESLARGSPAEPILPAGLWPVLSHYTHSFFQRPPSVSSTSRT